MISLVRHPRVAIAPGICYGRLDVVIAAPDSVTSIAEQVRAIGATVWSSPARRCRAVADAIGPHRIDARLLELDFGAWEGCRWDDIPRDELDRWAADPWGFAPPRGESGAALVQRVTAFRDDILAGDHVVVSHGGPLKVLMQMLRGETVDLMVPPPPLGSVTTIR
jgi:alpha-ribazole phosphatase